jgi:hypothetical protein
MDYLGEEIKLDKPSPTPQAFSRTPVAGMY